MESHEFRFSLKASVVRRLGEEVGPDEVISIAELIKNAYDADAGTVTVEINTRDVPTRLDLHFQSEEAGYLKITDNGKGIPSGELQKRWLNFALSSKVKSEETNLKRTPIGGKGMGRAATSRLGRYVELFTSTGETSSHVAFDWNCFDDRPLHEVPVYHNSLGKEAQGTTICIFPLLNPSKLSAEAGMKIVTRLRDKISAFADRKTFRVLLKMNGEEIDLVKGEPSVSNQSVYFETIWKKPTPVLINEIISFWKSRDLRLSEVSVEDRARQVVIIIRSQATHQIVGLSTAMEVRFKQLNNNLFYYYRTIVIPEFRQPGLASRMIVDTKNILEQYSSKVTANPCIGMITFVENQKLQQARRETIWAASRMMFLGIDKEGRHIRVCYFANARI